MNIISILANVNSPVTAELKVRLWDGITAVYENAASTLPQGDVWGANKIREGAATAERVELVFPDNILPKNVKHLLELMSYGHDTGRLWQTQMASRGEKPNGIRHGRWSSDLLEPVLANPLGSSLWKAVEEAIDGHSLPKTPSREYFSSDVAYALCAMLRDLDKMGGFDKANAYTADREHMALQAKKNGLDVSDDNPRAEYGEILTKPGKPSVLEVFLLDKAVIRDDCASYEAYMLQFLSWLGDFNLPETRQVVINLGGPAMVLRYLRQQLGVENDAYQCIALHAHQQWGLEIH